MKQLIMMVDDDIGILSLYGMLFEQHGYQVMKAKDAMMALTLIEEDMPDLFILDVMMPEIDGIMLCEKLKAKPSTANVPVFFLSARGDAATMEQAYAAGGEDYFVKPFKPEDLLQKMENLFEALAGVESE